MYFIGVCDNVADKVLYKCGKDVEHINSGTGNVPNKNRLVRGVDNFSSYKVVFRDSEKIFTFLDAEMSAASNGAKII